MQIQKIRVTINLVHELNLHFLRRKIGEPKVPSNFVYHSSNESAYPGKVPIGGSIPIYRWGDESLALSVKGPSNADLIHLNRSHAVYLSWGLSNDGVPNMTVSQYGWHDPAKREIVPGVQVAEDYTAIRGPQGKIVFDVEKVNGATSPTRLLVPNGAGPKILVKAI